MKLKVGEFLEDKIDIFRVEDVNNGDHNFVTFNVYCLQTLDKDLC